MTIAVCSTLLKCFQPIYILSSDGIMRRGCSYHHANSSATDACTESVECFECRTSKCNGKKRPSLRVNLFVEDLENKDSTNGEENTENLDNSAVNEHSYCVNCESGLDGNCVSISNPETLTIQCEGTYPDEKRGCYTLITGEQFIQFIFVSFSCH